MPCRLVDKRTCRLAIKPAAFLRLARTPGRDAVEDAEEGRVGRDGADDVDGGGHGPEVVDGGLGEEHQVGVAVVRTGRGDGSTDTRVYDAGPSAGRAVRRSSEAFCAAL